MDKLSPSCEFVYFCFGAPTVRTEFLRQVHSGSLLTKEVATVWVVVEFGSKATTMRNVAHVPLPWERRRGPSLA